LTARALKRHGRPDCDWLSQTPTLGGGKDRVLEVRRGVIKSTDTRDTVSGMYVRDAKASAYREQLSERKLVWTQQQLGNKLTSRLVWRRYWGAVLFDVTSHRVIVK